jgi:hypothetical protein
MKRESVYVETSIISYLCSRPSRDLVVAANQEITREWWDGRRHDYDLYVSEIVLVEIAAGDPTAAEKRLSIARGLPLLAATDEAKNLEGAILDALDLPRKVAADAAHIAIASVHGMNYLLTLNCAHIANPHWVPRLRKTIEAEGFDMPVICTPQELWEGEEA